MTINTIPFTLTALLAGKPYPSAEEYSSAWAEVRRHTGGLPDAAARGRRNGEEITHEGVKYTLTGVSLCRSAHRPEWIAVA